MSKQKIKYNRLGLHPKEMSELIRKAKKGKIVVFGEPDEYDAGLRHITYIKHGDINMECWFYDGKKCIYALAHDTEEPIYTMMTGGDVWCRYKRWYFTDGDYNPENAKWNEEDDYRVCAKALLWYNETYSGQRIDDCYGYDINSAYASVLLANGWIDTTNYRVNDYVGENEIGMDYDYEEGMILVYKGKAKFVFPRKPLPDKIKKFIQQVYEEKKDASKRLKNPKLTDKQFFDLMKQKTEAKNSLNYLIGDFQNYDPFIRAWVVCLCNDYIKSNMDDDTLLSNTDSIISKRKRDDLEQNLGDDIGKWKLEHTGQFAFAGVNYQWDYEIPTYRGIPKVCFTDKYDILKDKPLPIDTKWYFDPEKIEYLPKGAITK
jgi:hypothetical protein